MKMNVQLLSQAEVKSVANIRQMLDSAFEKQDNARTSLLMAFPNVMAVNSDPDDNNR